MQQIEKTGEDVLIALCRAGNDTGYTELYNRYAKRVYNSICRFISHTGEAEDILQESFYLAFENISRLKKSDSFGSWVNRIAVNQSISFLRKKKINLADLYMDIPDTEVYDVKDDQLFDCRVDDVRNAIEQLPEGYRTIISLYLFEDISQEEISKMLGVSYTTVRTQYHRAKKKVMQLLKDKTYHE